VPNHGDICAIDWTTVEPVDVLTGGFPCQPHSLAGLRAGSNDERDLFDEIIRCAGVLRPRFIVLENVPGLFTSDAGRFFGRVLGALASLGYDAEWRVLSAADVGAPHKRERVWIVAYADRGRREQRDENQRQSAVSGARHVSVGDTGGIMADPSGSRLEGREWSGEAGTPGRSDRHVTERSKAVGHAHCQRGRGWSLHGDAGDAHASSQVVRWRDAVPVRGADNTVRLIPSEAAEGGPESPLWPVAYGVSGRVARLRGIGNSIVPACAVEIFRTIDHMINQEGDA